MKRKLKIAAIALAGIFLLLQLTNPARTNPPVKRDCIASLNPPADVAASLRAGFVNWRSRKMTIRTKTTTFNFFFM